MGNIYTIEDMLKAVSPLISDEAVSYILVRRGIEPGTSVYDMEERDIDLAEGLAYYWLSNLPVGGTTVKDADGDWSHSEGGWQVSNANVEEWRKRYKALYSKWDEAIVDTSSKVRLINLC